MLTNNAPPDFSVGFGLPFWLDLPRPQFPTVDRDLDTDAVVIGAGIFGLKSPATSASKGFAVSFLMLVGWATVPPAATGRQSWREHWVCRSYQSIWP